MICASIRRVISPLPRLAATSDTDNRIESDGRAVESDRAIFGFTGSIGHTESDNTETGFRCDVLTKIIATPRGCAQTTDDAWIIFRADTYASNVLLAGHSSILIGTPVYGAIAAVRNGRGRAILDSWRPASDWMFRTPARTREKFRPAIADGVGNGSLTGYRF